MQAKLANAEKNKQKVSFVDILDNVVEGNSNHSAILKNCGQEVLSLPLTCTHCTRLYVIQTLQTEVACVSL